MKRIVSLQTGMPRIAKIKKSLQTIFCARNHFIPLGGSFYACQRQPYCRPHFPPIKTASTVENSCRCQSAGKCRKEKNGTLNRRIPLKLINTIPLIPGLKKWETKTCWKWETFANTPIKVRFLATVFRFNFPPC